MLFKSRLYMQKFQMREDHGLCEKKNKRKEKRERKSPSSAEGEGGQGIPRKGWLRPMLWGLRGYGKDWTLTQCNGCCGRIHRGMSDWCFRNTSVTVMAPDTRPWLRAFLLLVQHLCCVDTRAIGEPESAEKKLSMQKEEEPGCTQLPRKVRNPPSGPPWQPLGPL